MADHLMYMGTHKGKPISAIPSAYLEWCLQTWRLSSGFRAGVTAELESRGQKAPAPPPPKPEPSCRQCGAGPDTINYSWLQTRHGRRQIRRTCGHCGEWLGSAPQIEPYLSRANAAASATPVLDVLTRCEELGIRLRSDGAAVNFASSEDWHRATPGLRNLVRQCRHSLAKMIGPDPVPTPAPKIEVVQVVDSTRERPGHPPATVAGNGPNRGHGESRHG
jgi:hypothetical protein